MDQITEIVNNYLDQITGHFNKRTLARKIVLENPHILDDTPETIDYIRGKIRYRTGSIGDDHRKRAKTSGTLRKHFLREEMKPSEYMAEFMSKGEKTSDEIIQIHDHKNILVLPDIHMPYHDIRAIDTALNDGFKNGIDAIYLNGDVFDFYQISRYSRDPDRKGMSYEIEIGRQFFEGLVGLGLPVYWKLGNHEDRWDAYIIKNAPELRKIEELQLGKLLFADKFDIAIIKSKQRVKFGSLNVIHGHEFGESFFNPVNPARGLFLKAKTSVLAGHNHQTSSHHENNLNGKPTACFSMGCLCDLEPEYRPFAYTKWNHGFARVEVESDDWFVHNHRIIDGKLR
jgi:predicted phosphodiesterase